jgi:AraC-like DNA-binding protein
VLLLYGNRHRLRVAGDIPYDEHRIGAWPVGEAPATLTLGQGKPAAKFISAALRSVYNPVSVQSMHPLSESIHLRHGLQPFFADTALLTDMAQISTSCSGPGAGAFINALMNLHLFHAFRCAYRKMEHALPLVSPMEILRSPSIRPIAVAVRLLRMHPERHWTVAALARELGQSRSSLAANFSACVGVGPMEYLNKLRMEKAAELLQSRRDLSLCVIGRQVGYDNTSSFARAFKAHFGVPPKAYSTQGPTPATPVATIGGDQEQGEIRRSL